MLTSQAHLGAGSTLRTYSRVRIAPRSCCRWTPNPRGDPVFVSCRSVFIDVAVASRGAIWRLFPWRRTDRYIVVAVASLNRRSRIAQRQDFDHQNPAQERVDRDKDHHGDDCREGAPPHRRGKGRNHQDHPTILRHPVFTNMLTTPSSDLLTQFEYSLDPGRSVIDFSQP